MCGNRAGPPLPAPAPKPDKEPPAKKAKASEGAPFSGTGRRLADGPFELAAAPSRSAFLDALEAAQPAAAPTAAAPAATDVDDVIVISDSEEVLVRRTDAKRHPSAPELSAHGAGADSGALCAAALAAVAAPAAASARAPGADAPTAAAAAAASRAAAAARRPAPKPAAKVVAFDPFNPPQYVPRGGFQLGGELRVRETAQLLDIDGRKMPAAALLDTGNESCTLISRAAALRAGLADRTGMPAGLAGTRVEWQDVHGVVEGARERIPLLRITYEIHGKKLSVKGVSQAPLTRSRKRG